MKIRIWALLFVCIVFGGCNSPTRHAMGTASEGPGVSSGLTVDGLLDEWDKWLKATAGLSGFEQISYEPIPRAKLGDSKGVPRVLRTLQLQNKFGVSTSEIRSGVAKGNYFAVANSQYIATAHKGIDGWLLDSVTLPTDPMYGTEFERIFFHAAARDFFGLPSIKELRASHATIEPVAVEHGASAFRIIFDRASERHERIEVLVTETHDWLPERVQIDYGPSSRIVEVSDWTKIDGNRLWMKETWWIPIEEDPAETTQVTETRYDVINRNPEREQCFLSYYGLPEPKGLDGGGARIWMWVAVTLALGVVACVIYWRGKR